MGDCRSEVPVFSKVANEYLENMMLDMMKAVNKNGKPVFTGFLSPENFCIGTELAPADQPGPNAYAWAQKGLVVFNSSLLIRATDASYVAGVLAHELAHITLNHGADFPSHTYALSGPVGAKFEKKVERFRNDNNNLIAVYNEYANYVDLEILASRVENLISRRGKSEIDYNDLLQAAIEGKACADPECSRFLEYFVKFNQAIAKMELHRANIESFLGYYFSEEDLANKKEKDADEVGFELYARAGWAMEKYTGFQITTLMAIHPKAPKFCLQSTKAELERGKRAHPYKCWRLHNILDEYISHRKDFKKYAVQGKRVRGPTLEQVKADIQLKLNALPSVFKKPVREDETPSLPEPEGEEDEGDEVGLDI